MKTLILIPVLLFATAAMASQNTYEITPLVGYNIAEGELGFKDDYIVGGLELQYNNKDWFLSPELSVLYSQNLDYVYSDLTANIIRVAINGVYQYDALSFMTPFTKIGAGMEYLSSTKLYGNEDSAFADVGAGAKIHFTDHIALKLETLYMLKYNSGRYDSNAVLLAGINISFGGGKVKHEIPSQEEGTTKSSLSSHQNATTNTSTAIDPKDTQGKANLHIIFETNSFSVDEQSKENIKKFADFLEANPSYYVQIIGYTDNIGSPLANQYLSQKRANIVRNLLIVQGVSSQRLTSIGEGENNNIAPNITEDGRAQNRRIEVTLTTKTTKD